MKPETDLVSADDREPDRVDWLDLGPEPDEGPTPAGPRRRRLWYAAAAALVAMALVMTRTQHGTNRAASTGSPSRTSTPSSPAGTVSSSPTPSGSFVDPATVTAPSDGQRLAGPAAAPRVTRVGHPLLAVPADWELFAQGPGVLVRIQLALGRITTTTVPMSTGHGPATLIVGSDRALVRSSNDAGAPTGYVVPDGKPAATLPRRLRPELQMLPGPDQRHVWTDASDRPGLALVNLDGKPTGVTIEVPPDGTVQGTDGAGYVLLTSINGLYDARPGRVHRITSGPLLASGPTRWLAEECNDNLACADVVIDRAAYARHMLQVPISYAGGDTGTISPDGKTAALLAPSDGISLSSIQLLDLDSGIGRLVDVSALSSDDAAASRLVWSPDSRWLFTIDGGGRVIIVNRDTGRATPLAAEHAAVTHLALRHRAG